MPDEVVALTPRQLRDALSQACEMAGGRLAWARKHRFPPSVVTETIQGLRRPSDGVLAAMGLMRVDRYIRTRRGANAPLAGAL